MEIVNNDRYNDDKKKQGKKYFKEHKEHPMLRTSLSHSTMRNETRQNYKINELNIQCLGV